MNEAKFKPQRYRDSRPFYPNDIYGLLLRHLGDTRISHYLDLGCGTGQSFLSFASLGRSDSGTGIDIDPGMIAEAELRGRPHELRDFPLHFATAPAEALPFSSGEFDLALVGSAIHWFHVSAAKRELERVLKPGSLFYVYEYQFPKALRSPEMNEWIRRKFNTEWKAPHQSPRGKLSDVLAPFREDRKNWIQLGTEQPTWIEEMTLESFLGNLFSQSRYLHAEEASSSPIDYQSAITEQLRPFFGEGPLLCDLKPRSFLFRYLS